MNSKFRLSILFLIAISTMGVSQKIIREHRPILQAILLDTVITIDHRPFSALTKELGFQKVHDDIFDFEKIDSVAPTSKTRVVLLTLTCGCQRKDTSAFIGRLPYDIEEAESFDDYLTEYDEQTILPEILNSEDGVVICQGEHTYDQIYNYLFNNPKIFPGRKIRPLTIREMLTLATLKPLLWKDKYEISSLTKGKYFSASYELNDLINYGLSKDVQAEAKKSGKQPYIVPDEKIRHLEKPMDHRILITLPPDNSRIKSSIHMWFWPWDKKYDRPFPIVKFEIYAIAIE